MIDRIASTKDVATALRLSAATIQGYARAGRIPCDQTPGGHRRFDVAEVQAALLTANADSVEIEIGRPRRKGLGHGTPRPSSENAQFLLAVRGTRPELRDSTVTGPTGESALGSLVSHARNVLFAHTSA